MYIMKMPAVRTYLNLPEIKKPDPKAPTEAVEPLSLKEMLDKLGQSKATWFAKNVSASNIISAALWEIFCEEFYKLRPQQ